jgi:hypothetical protein
MISDFFVASRFEAFEHVLFMGYGIYGSWITVMVMVMVTVMA